MSPAQQIAENRNGSVALLARPDFKIIGEIIEPRSKVLDLGCGEGELLAWLRDNKQVNARGVEIDSAQVRKAIGRGVSVYQGDIDEGLTDYPDKAFDYVILSQTLQETKDPLRVLRQMLRVGRRAIVSFPNFGHWTVRWSSLVSGRSPMTEEFPHKWYKSPNIHFFTLQDFEDLCTEQGIRVERRFFLSGSRRLTVMPNLFAQTAVFVLGEASQG